MQNRRTHNGQRQGVASLELVMCFPVLVVLVAMLFTMGMATKIKSRVTMDVRHQAWAARTTPRNTMPFSVTQAHSAGRATHERVERLNMYRNLFPFIPRDIEWGNAVLTGSWDFRQTEFAEAGWLPIYPHLGVLTKMATAQGGINTNASSVGRLNSLTNIPRN